MSKLSKVAAVLLLLAALPTAAAARVKGPRLSSTAAGCGALQDEADQLRAEYASVGASNPNSPRLDEIITRLREIGSDWNAIGCQAAYGSISIRVSPGGRAGQLNRALDRAIATPGVKPDPR